MTKVSELDDEQAYEAELRQCVGVTGYHHWFFLSALADAHNYRFRAFAVDFAGERLGVVPLLFRRHGPISTANFVPVGCIGPVIRGEALRAGLIGQLLRGADSILRRHRTVAARWGFSPGLNLSSETLASHGFDVFPWENYVIPGTKSVDDLLKSMSRSRRQSINRHIRRAQDRGMSVEESSPEEITRWLPEQVMAVYERQGQPPLYNLTGITALTERLAYHPRMLWRTVKEQDGNAVAVAGCVIGDDRLWGWLISGTPVNGVSVQILCYWDLIKWSLSRGLALDLGGAPNEGIRELKVSIGADTESAVRVLQFHPRAAYKAAAALRNWGPVRANWTRMRWMIGDR
jgi:CelD/BcsL family acetyltransferase involved in cellulose biosynthesis